MKDQDWGAETTQNQPGRKQAHSSISGHFISSSPETTPERNLFSSLLFLRFIYFKIILWMRPVYYTYLWIFWRLKKKYVDLRCSSHWLRRERVTWAAATAATLDNVLVCVCLCAWDGDSEGKETELEVLPTAQNRPPVVRVCIGAAGVCLWRRICWVQNKYGRKLCE